MKISKTFKKIIVPWVQHFQEKPIEAGLSLEEKLEELSVTLIKNYTWPKIWNQPPFLLPFKEKHAEKINAILIKSWETQGSTVKEMPFYDHTPECTLLCDAGRVIPGQIKYYLDCLGVSQDIKRIVGVMEVPALGPVVGTFLQVQGKFDKFPIDNTFSAVFDKHSKDQYHQRMMFEVKRLDFKYLDKDPKFEPRCRVDRISLEDQRVLYGPDEKIEQFNAFVSACRYSAQYHMYDILMRRFIKEKFGIEIQSLLRKWSKLCWNCSAQPESKLKICSVCKIASYCGKECQALDWKVHKLLHIIQRGADHSVLHEVMKTIGFRQFEVEVPEGF